MVPANTCHSDEDITTYLRRKFIIVLQNEVRFKINEYSDEGRIKPQSRLIWHPIASAIRQDIVQRVSTTELELQDTQLLQVGPFTSLEGSIFEIKPFVIRPYEFFDDVHTSVSFEFDLNYHKIDRETYNTLDWLGDLGGLKEALVIILGIVYGLANYHTFKDYLVS